MGIGCLALLAYSTRTLAFFISASNLICFDLKKSADSDGLVPFGSAPSPERRARTSESLTIRETSLESLAIIFDGVEAGAINPSHQVIA
jgi:hypothetical protein